MIRSEYEERLRVLEAQRQADIALINAAHEIRVRSLERLCQAPAEADGVAAVPAVPGNGTLPAPAFHTAVSAAPAAAPRKLRQRGEVLFDLEKALPQFPEVFDRRDIVRVLGYEPPRATLFRALRQLQADGAVAMEDYCLIGTLNAYRKVPRAG